MSLAIVNGMVLDPSRGLCRRTVHVDGKYLRAVTDPGGAMRSGDQILDARGLLVLPGIVDVHGDAFERELNPRSGVAFDTDIALLAADRQMVAWGITTAFHSITWSWEPGLRSPANARRLIGRIHALRSRLTADTRIHLRFETHALDEVNAITEGLGAGLFDVLSFNDHTPEVCGYGRDRQKLARYTERSGLDADAYADLAARMLDRAGEVPAAIRRLAATARDHGVAMMSHDDPDPQTRRSYAALGVEVAEFPITAEVAAVARAEGAHTVFGAPNILRGGSHRKRANAAEMVEAGLCSVLASDYYYPALIIAPFMIARRGTLGLAEAWKLVSANPAEALGLTDRGAVAAARRADLLLVEEHAEGPPQVVAVLRSGRLVAITEPDRLVAARMPANRTKAAED